MAANPITESGLDLSWLNLYDEPTSAVPGKKGLTLKEINLGKYADERRGGGDMTYRARGAIARPGAQRFGPNYQNKSDVWSENCIMLYEEATQRQWSSARDIPWETLEALPDEIERAMCQLCTMLTEVEFIAGDVPGQWMPFVSAQDESRHLAFGVMHLKYVLDTEPERREEIHHYLDKAEGDAAGGGSGDVTFPPVFESLCLLLGGGADKFDEGLQKFLLLRKRQINEYMHRLEVIGLGDRRERMAPGMREFLDPVNNN